MIQISISDISKNPGMIDKLDDVAEILNKKTRQVKGIFVPTALLGNFQEVLDEIEYRKFVERNRSLCTDLEEDPSIEDGLDDAAW